MEYPGIEDDSVSSGIKRRVKDRIAKTKLNVSLASKIKTKILNNSSIFKISLKHNNRALARALSKEKENSRRITTEKVQLQKEVEKLNFENTFLRLKLNNLNKKLIEIESQVSNSLLTAIEMSSLSEFHQSSFLLSANKKKRVSKQCKPAHLPYARVLITSENDDDDDGDDDKWKTKCNNRTVSKTSPDSTSSVSRQSLSLHQCNLEVFLPQEDNQKTCESGHSEYTSSVDVLPNESHYHSDQSPKSFLSKMKDAPSPSPIKEKLSLGNVTKRKKCVSSAADILHVADLDHQSISSPGSNWNNEINGCTNETSNNVQRNTECFPDLPSESSSGPNVKCMEQVQKNTDTFHLQKTVYEDADMELTATDIGKIVTISKSNKSQNKKKADCRKETFRKVKGPSSDRKKERSKRKCKASSEGAEGKTENRPERGSGVLDGRGDSEDPNCISNSEQPSQVNMQKEITFQKSSDQENVQNQRRRQTYTTDEQEETNPFSRCSVKFLQDGKFDPYQNTLHCDLSKPSRQTFVIQTSEKDNLLPNQDNKENISENLEDANEFHIAHLSIKDNENVCDHETQTILDLKKNVNAQQNQTKINKTKQKINRRTKIISITNQINEDNDKDIHVLEKGNFPFQTQANKETTSGNLEASKEFETPLYTRDSGSLHDCNTQNVLDLHKQITSIYPGQNKSQISKIPRQKLSRKTEVISEVNCFSNDRDVLCSEKDESFLLQKDKEIPGTLKDVSEFDKPAFYNKDSVKSCDFKAEPLLGLKRHDPNMPPACQADSKVDKKLRQKVKRKTEIISKINQIHKNDEGSAHDPLNKELRQKVSISKIISEMNQIYETINEDGNAFKSSLKHCQDVMSCDFGKKTSNEEENHDLTPDLCSLVKKPRKKVSCKAGNSLTGDKNRCILQLTGSSQESVTLDSGLKHGPNEADSGPGEQTNLPKKQKPSTVSTLGDAFSLSVVREGSHPAQTGSKVTSKSKKRKTPLRSSDTRGAVERTPNTDGITAVYFQQTEKENYLENEKIAKSKPDFRSKVLKPLSEICSSNIKNSSLGSMCESSVPLSTFSSKPLMLEESSSLDSTCIFPVGDGAHEKLKEGTPTSHCRTQKSRPGSRTSLVLVDNSSVSSNTANPENESERHSSHQMRRKRQCTPLNLTEPSLRSKMRR